MTGGSINRIFLTALLAGAFAGLVLASIQQFTVVPMILEAETYETAAGASHSHGHGHDDHGGAAAGDEAWAPQEGTERSFYTFVNSVIAGIGFALLLAACYAIQKNVNWRNGVLWGLGGFAAFHLAPSLGLPPELPGAAAAELGARQEWWLLTVVLTAGGLLLLAFVSGAIRWLGLALIVVPHLLGAPQPESHGGLAPAELANAFIYTSLLTDAIFWVVLGVASALLYRRFGRTASAV
ncbi:MAG: CbtA family protein [Pseudomonadales bacterium]